MKFFSYIAIIVVVFAHMILGYQNYGQGSQTVEKEFCLAEPCETLTKEPASSSLKSESNIPKCECGEDHS
uniref:Salivary secreted peptide n=1 Tax=Anopheles funestus TaxID=62324 RepID=A0A182RDH3_ANOFN